MTKWLTRRGVVATGVASVATVGVAGGASLLACGTEEDPNTLAALDRLDEALPDIKFADRLAMAVKAEVPEQDMLTAVRTHPALQKAMHTSCPATRRAQIRTICQDDFKTGDWLVVDRLVVSKTECLIAGLRA